MITLKELPEAAMRAMREHAAREYPNEACGLLALPAGKSLIEYLPCKNTSTKPGDYFEISGEEYANAEEQGEIVAVFHTHPDAVADASEIDLSSCQASKLPWFIVSWPFDVWNEVRPDFVVNEPLYGREFRHGTLDCFGFIQAWFAQELDVQLATPAREDEWWKAGQNLYLDNYEKWGFVRVDDNAELQLGDVLLMQVHSDVPNHGAVYLGDNIIGHHLYGRLSNKDVYGGYWRRHTTHVMRHKELVDAA